MLFRKSESLISLPISSIQHNISQFSDSLESKCYRMISNTLNYFRGIILPAMQTSKSSTLVWYHNLQDMMLRTRSGLELSGKDDESRKPKEI